ncbi:HvfC/BufC family peptide modification chaperone [Yunchengibacter salinarum]|uniref:HvfC/BufC family peptide modification chaperone n=1 Tax=Yunchengibacter salinarum TaxID=3133399 RepID=UPI0035B66FAF
MVEQTASAAGVETGQDLASFQRAVTDHILDRAPVGPNVLNDIIADGIPPENRLQVHANTYRQTLVDALYDLFPLMITYVGERFVRAALARYVLADPPREPRLSAYGGGVGPFLDSFEPAEKVPFIADLARLEWAVHEIQHTAPESVSAQAINALLATARPAQALRDLRLVRHGRVIASRWPVVSLWMAGKGQIPPEAVHLEQGGQTALVLQIEGAVHLMPLEGAAATVARYLGARGTETHPDPDATTSSEGLTDLAARGALALV